MLVSIIVMMAGTIGTPAGASDLLQVGLGGKTRVETISVAIPSSLLLARPSPPLHLRLLSFVLSVTRVFLHSAQTLSTGAVGSFGSPIPHPPVAFLQLFSFPSNSSPSLVMSQMRNVFNQLAKAAQQRSGSSGGGSGGGGGSGSSGGPPFMRQSSLE